VPQTFGFTPGAQNTDAALRTLTVAYAVLPCVLAIVLALPRRTGA
jgi:Na+/melibiose symporter-like transporter